MSTYLPQLFSKQIVAALFIALSFTCFAKSNEGGVDSGGGILVSHADNPWWLQNTPEVSYCIELDESHFGQNRENVTTAIAKAIAFWKKQFQDLGPSKSPPYEAAVGTQNFILSNCHPGIDLKFQFGTLSEEQRKMVDRPQNYAGFSMRTSYDTKNLRGRGFIYISPEHGPLKMEMPGLAKNVWSSHSGMRLVPVLVHELGHVFGLQHGSLEELMESNYPSIMVSQQGTAQANIFVHNVVVPKLSLFKFTGTARSGSYLVGFKENGSFQRFFGLESNRDWSGIMSVEKNEFLFKKGFTYEEIGRAQLNIEPTRFIGETYEYLTEVFLPKDQEVFKDIRMMEAIADPEVWKSSSIKLAHYVKSVRLKGDYQSKDGRIKRKIVINVDLPSGRTRFGGVLDGEFYFNLINDF